MKKTSKFRAIFWLLLLFASGAVLGSTVSSHGGVRSGWWISRALMATPESRWIEWRQGNLVKHLELTPEQMEILAPAFEEAESGLREVREDAVARIQRIVIDNNLAIQAVLTEDQAARFKKMLEKFIKRLQSRRAQGSA
ncbi:MAG: hypothetical protein ACC661_05815 [Verrucomicrobiales bacterium]